MNEIINNLDISLLHNKQSKSNKLQKTTDAIHICNTALHNLKSYINQHLLATKKDEIHFFKYIKPKVMSKLI